MATPRQGTTRREATPAPVNEVRLIGRVAQVPSARELPSGDVLWNVRVIVDRDPASVRCRPPVDALECVAWGGRVQRTLAGWRAGDVVEVYGALRRRFYRAGAASVSQVEIDLSRARLIRRARSG